METTGGIRQYRINGDLVTKAEFRAACPYFNPPIVSDDQAAEYLAQAYARAFVRRHRDKLKA